VSGSIGGSKSVTNTVFVHYRYISKTTTLAIQSGFTGGSKSATSTVFLGLRGHPHGFAHCLLMKKVLRDYWRGARPGRCGRLLSIDLAAKVASLPASAKRTGEARTSHAERAVKAVPSGHVHVRRDTYARAVNVD
jgi:hypothetical protein